MRTLASRLALSGLVALSLFGAACAKEADPINRVQANALDKRLFVGADILDPNDDPEFYSRSYTVDASASQSVLAPGSWAHVDRIRWEVTEDILYARKAYQIADGQDCRAVKPEDAAKGLFEGRCDYLKINAPTGTIVAAYRIEKHFDIRRDYNPATGQESNVIVENTMDKAWNERRYMRVDWSRNIVDNPMEWSTWLSKLRGMFRITGASYAITDPDHEDAPHFEFPDKSGRTYFDVTNRYLVSPVSGGRGIPTCYLMGSATGSATYECDAQEATVRHSYWQVDPTHDFEPLENTRASLDVVGNPGGSGSSGPQISSPGRQRWDPRYGFTDENYFKFANIHNVWVRSHQDATCQSNEDADKDGTADQCSNEKTGYAGNRGSQCDVHTNTCTIPVRDRQIKTVGYWINRETPEMMLDVVGPDGQVIERGPMEDVVYSFNQLMSVAVATRREVECRRTRSGDRDECHAQFFDSTADPNTKQMVSYGGWLIEKPKDPSVVLTFCHNPVRDYDHESCGEPGYQARLGDIRHNFIFYWPHRSRAGWGGVANWNADPLTGEILGAAAQTMGRSVTSAAAQVRDVIQLALGDIKPQEIMEGPSTNYSQALLRGRLPAKPPLSRVEMEQRVEALNLTHLQGTLGTVDIAGRSTEEQIQFELEREMESVAEPTALDSAHQEYEALANLVRGSQYESQLVDQEWLVSAAGLSPQTELSQETMEFVSPLRGMDPFRQKELTQVITNAARDHGMCFNENEAPVAGSVISASLAEHFGAKYAGMDPVARGEAIYNDLSREIAKGITLHELGHSLGMFHNFASSWDAPNYTPQYWQLRTNEGKAWASCNVVVGANTPRTGADDNCLGPRYFDPQTPDEEGRGPESRPDILYYAHTSTMEYTFERFAETMGNGTYDQHAMKALYGRVLETFDDKEIPQEQQQYFRFKNSNQQSRQEFFFEDSNFARQLHYTDLARRMKVFDPNRDCRPATNEEKAKGGWRVVHGKVCAPPPKDHWAWEDFISDAWGTDPNAHAPYWHVRTPEGKHLVRWPYRWGQVTGFMHISPGDAGADPYELATNYIKKFEIEYPFTYFRRERREYSGGMPANATSGIISQMRQYIWNIALNMATTSEARVLNDTSLQAQAMAQAEIFKFLSRIITMPEPGDYYDTSKLPSSQHKPVGSLLPLYDVPGAGIAPPAGVKPDFTIGLGDGRYLSSAYDFNMGGAWTWTQFVKHVGFSTEKQSALHALVESRPTQQTISRRWTLDSRRLRMNLRDAMPEAVDRLVGGLLAEDWESVAAGTAVDGGLVPEPFDLTSRTGVPRRPDGSKVIAPNIGYRTQLATAIYTMLFSRFNSDRTLTNKMHVYVEGSNVEEFPPAQQVRFLEPAPGGRTSLVD